MDKMDLRGFKVNKETQVLKENKDIEVLIYLNIHSDIVYLLNY